MLTRRTLFAALAAGGASLAVEGARAETAIELRPDLAETFAAAGTEGTIAVLELRRDKMVMTDETRARRRELPASTFKVPHALIALETGVVADADGEIIHWDGVPREIEEWNRDHTLRSAMKYSVVPVFQQIARRVGAERMQKYVDAFDYGNRDIGGAIDRFWLDGNLRISPLEQIQFFARLCRRDLPVSARSLDLVADIVPVEKLKNAAIHAKTGTVVRDKPVLGWLVGWADGGEDVAIFAMNIDLRGKPELARRMPMLQSVLDKIGAI